MTTMPLRALLAATLFALALAGPVGCGSSGPQVKEADGEEAEITPTPKGDRVIKRFDLNGDGKPDMEKAFLEKVGANGEKTQVLVERKVDLDYNGTVDLVGHYDENGNLRTEDVDLDFDGRMDAVNVYEDGRVVEQRLAPGFDGSMAVWRYFNKEGELSKKARDTNDDGKPDAWEYYANNRLIRMGYDRDGDGKPEYFEDSEALK